MPSGDARALFTWDSQRLRVGEMGRKLKRRAKGTESDFPDSQCDHLGHVLLVPCISGADASMRLRGLRLGPGVTTRGYRTSLSVFGSVRAGPPSLELAARQLSPVWFGLWFGGQAPAGCDCFGTEWSSDFL